MGATPKLPLRSHPERHVAFCRHARLEASDERRGQTAGAHDQVEDERGRVIGEADDERQHDQRHRDGDVRVAVEERDDPDDSRRPWRSHREHGGADAERECDRLGRGIVEAENEGKDDQDRSHGVVEYPVDYGERIPRPMSLFRPDIGCTSCWWMDVTHSRVALVTRRR
jgi:hypothetical protein